VSIRVSLFLQQRNLKNKLKNNLMPKNWKTYKLSEVIQIIGGGTPKTSIPEFWNGSIPWLSVKDFQGEQKFVFQTEKTITEEGLKKSFACP
jgi:type I restriction enzyme S subunit